MFIIFPATLYSPLDFYFNFIYVLEKMPFFSTANFSGLIVLEQELTRAQRDVWNQIRSRVMGSAWQGVLDALAQANGLAGSERPDCPLCAATDGGVWR